MPLSIRFATLADASEIARLLTQLGHSSTAADIAAKWTAWEAAGNLALVVPGENDTLAGIATLGKMVTLHRPKPVGRVVAIVVDETCQRRGIGKLLMSAAEDYLRKEGCYLVELTSNTNLVNAHQFYHSLGYRITSHRFMKEIG
ncbi:MAG: GNAT family N-acetyltransferase [Gemmatales bacterium]